MRALLVLTMLQLQVSSAYMALGRPSFGQLKAK